MQGGKGAVASVLEAAANVAASAKSGLDKTKAVVEEKVERISTKDEVEKDMASLRKEEKLDLAERRKCKAYAQNAAAAAAPPGAVSPNFTDGGGFHAVNPHNKPAAAILSSDGSATSVVDSNVIQNHTELPVSQLPRVDYNSHHVEVPAQMVQPIPVVDSDPAHMEIPGSARK